MTRAHWLILGLVTAINVGAAGVSVYIASEARADFRAAAAPIAQLGAAILDEVRRINPDGQ